MKSKKIEASIIYSRPQKGRVILKIENALILWLIEDYSKFKTHNHQISKTQLLETKRNINPERTFSMKMEIRKYMFHWCKIC